MNEHPASHTIELNGAALYYEERGHGAPLVLVHGGLASSAQWEPVARELADGFRVITPDSRGHGRSTNPSGKLSYSGIAADLPALIVALGLRHPVVGGWSDGGQVEAVSRYHGGPALAAGFRRVAERRGTNKARVAVARKDLTLVYYGLRDGEIRCLAQAQAA